MTVRVLDRWTGFCLACRHDERPLVLTLAGASGLRSWLDGAGWHDRDLHLTCEVCGYREPVPWDEADDPQPVSDWRDLEPPVLTAVPVAVPVPVPVPVTVPAPAPAAAPAARTAPPPVPVVVDLPAPVAAPRAVVALPRPVVELPAPAAGPVLELLAAELHLSA